MSDIQVIEVQRVHNGWLKLLLHLQNSVPGVFQLVFPDAESARNASSRMSANISRNPTWFRLVLLQRGSCIYVIKTDFMHKVAIR